MGSEKSKRVAQHAKGMNLSPEKFGTPKKKVMPPKQKKKKEAIEKEPYERRDSGISESSYPGSMYRGRYSTATYGIAQFGTQTIEMKEFGIQTERTRQKGVDKLIPICDYVENAAQTLCHVEMQTVPETQIHREKDVAVQTVEYDEGGLKVEEVATQTVFHELMMERLYSEPDYNDPFVYDDQRFLVSAAARYRDQQAKLKVKIVRPKEIQASEEEEGSETKKAKKGKEKDKKKDKKEKKKKKEKGEGTDNEKKRKKEKSEGTDKKKERKKEKSEGTDKKKERKKEKSEGKDKKKERKKEKNERKDKKKKRKKEKSEETKNKKGKSLFKFLSK